MILYYGADNNNGKRLEALLRRERRHRGLQVVHDTADIRWYFRLTGYVGPVCVLVIESASDLQALLEVGSLLLDAKTIIVCPLQQGQLVDGALRLYPRYLSSAEGDFQDVLAVVQRLEARLTDI